MNNLWPWRQSTQSSVKNNQSKPETSTCLVNETIKGSHLYRVEGYSLAKGIGPGKYISSSVFNVGGCDWVIRFYPDGDDPGANSIQYVSVYLALATTRKKVRAVFGLSLLDQSGNGNHRMISSADSVPDYGPYIFKHKGNMWGYSRLMKRSELESSHEYLKDDCLELHCTVAVVKKTRKEKTKKYAIDVPPTNMGHCFKQILDSGVASDIVFEVDGEILKAHKHILAARCPVFRAQFFGPLGIPMTDRVVVEDIAPYVIEAMLLFIYTDLLPDLGDLKQKKTLSTDTYYVELLIAADLYGLDRLKLLCEEKLLKKVSVHTVASIIALAEQYSCFHLKSLCLKFAALPKNYGVVIKSESYQKLKELFPEVILELLQIVSTNGHLPK